MAQQSTEKQNENNSVNLSSISSVINIINTAFNSYKKPSPPLPPPLLLTAGQIRPGLSARDIAARIISRRSEAGLPSGGSSDGPNRREKEISIIIEEIIFAMQNDAVVRVAIQPGQTIIGSGIGNLGIPVFVQGATTTIGNGSGVIS